MQWVSSDGRAASAEVITLGEDDADFRSTAEIREALATGDVLLADQLFAAAQHVAPIPPQMAAAAIGPEGLATDPADPNPHTAGKAPSPSVTLTTEMREEIARGDAEFYRIFVYDSCNDDGDVVEILINGRPMFLVPITNAGATLSVPVSHAGTTVVTLRGAYDGHGGVTVACRTSQGDGFLRVLAPGELQPLGMVRP